MVALTVKRIRWRERSQLNRFAPIDSRWDSKELLGNYSVLPILLMRPLPASSSYQRKRMSREKLNWWKGCLITFPPWNGALYSCSSDMFNWNNISQTFNSASFFVTAICSQNPVGSHGRHQNRLDVDTVRSRSVWIGSIETGRINGQTVRAETGLESSRLAHQILNERDAMRSEVVARFGRVAQKESRPATSAQSGDNCNDDHREPAAHFRHK